MCSTVVVHGPKSCWLMVIWAVPHWRLRMYRFERFPRNMGTPNHCRCNFGCWVAMPHFRPAGSLGSARWECLKHAIHQIHEHNASSLSFEEPMAEPMVDGRPWRIWQMGLSEMGSQDLDGIYIYTYTHCIYIYNYNYIYILIYQILSSISPLKLPWWGIVP